MNATPKNDKISDLKQFRTSASKVHLRPPKPVAPQAQTTDCANDKLLIDWDQDCKQHRQTRLFAFSFF